MMDGPKSHLFCVLPEEPSDPLGQVVQSSSHQEQLINVVTRIPPSLKQGQENAMTSPPVYYAEPTLVRCRVILTKRLYSIVYDW